jgi:predicted enzyme related to lactoylglutathione lyase
MQRALRFYVDMLEFKNATWGTDDFTLVMRDGAAVYLCRGSQGRGGAWVWMGVGDAEKLHEELKAKGANILLPPTKYPWAIEFHVEDPDGNVLRLGSEPR